MKIKYFKLENSAGISVGSNKDCIEIDFENSHNKIISIQAKNGAGKSCLLSALTPFANVSTTIDERGALSFIKPGLHGYKEIHYLDKNNIYIIKHYYKPNKEGTHSVKSYFSLNGKELNENGNVSSFIELVELYLHITPEMIRLIRLGTNVNSFIQLPPSRRKDYIGKLITEIDDYMRIYKKINDDIKLAKAFIAANVSNINTCHINNTDEVNKEIKKLKSKLKNYINEKEKSYSLISEYEKMQEGISDVYNKIISNEKIIDEFNEIENEYNQINLSDNRASSDIQNEIIECKSKIKSTMISKDSLIKDISNLKNRINQISKGNNINDLISIVNDLRNRVNKNIIPIDIPSRELINILNKFKSWNQLGNMIYSFSDKAINKFIELKANNKNIAKYIKNQVNKSIILNRNDVSKLLKQLFKKNYMLMPNCDNEFKQCPFYLISEFITDDNSNDLLDAEDIKYLEIINNNFNFIINEINEIKSNLPGSLVDDMSESTILQHIHNKSILFDLKELNKLISLAKDYEAYLLDKEKLLMYEERLKTFKSIGIDNLNEEILTKQTAIREFDKIINELNLNFSKLNDEFTIKKHNEDIIKSYNSKKDLINEIKNNTKEYKEKYEFMSKAKNKLINEKNNYSLLSNEIKSLENDIHSLENRLNSFIQLTSENEKLNKRFKEMVMIQESVSTKKGIPVIYIKQYLGKIQKLTNELLKIIYDGSIKIGQFEITQDTFEIPYIKNGTVVSDVKYSSQSEISMIAMALSFALSNAAASKYNILLLDEIDSGLDDDNRISFLKMLDAQMEYIKSEQVFIISHNLSNGMANLPMDVIRLGETNFDSNLFNVIYE